MQAYRARRYREAIELFPAEIDSCRDPQSAARLCLLHGNALLGEGLNRQAREVYFATYRRCRLGQFLGEYRDIGAKALMNAGLATKNLGEYGPAIQFYREALRSGLVEKPLERVQARNLLGSLLSRLKQYDEAEAELQKALGEARLLGEELLCSDIYLNLAVLAFHQGDHAASERELNHALEAADGDHERHLRAWINMGTLLIDQHHAAGAWVYFDKAEDLARRTDRRKHLPLILANKARIRHRESATLEAVRLANEALQINEELQLEDQWVRECCREVLEENNREVKDNFRLAEVLIRSHDMIAVSESMRRIIRDIEALAGSELPVLVLGETGTGKELVARALHNAGSRRSAPFVPVNCPAIPDTLFESTLFGHVRGAFTGADRDSRGLVELAGEGTIFLDEIGDLPLSIQPKLLRFLESGEFQPMGSNEIRYSSARIVSATNRDLLHLHEQQQFREDLLMRISAFRIALPPLRERREDVYFIASAVLEEQNRRYGCHKTLSASALQVLNGYAFPGNVRELRNCILRGFQVAERCIEPEALALPAGNGSMSGVPQVRAERAQRDWRSTLGRAMELPEGLSLEEALNEMERRVILQALELRSGDREKVAEDLGLSFRALKYKISKYGIKSRKRFRDRGARFDEQETRG